MSYQIRSKDMGVLEMESILNQVTCTHQNDRNLYEECRIEL